MTEPCIYCGTKDHEVADTVIGKVTACPRMPRDQIIMVTKQTLARIVNLSHECGECDGSATHADWCSSLKLESL